MIPKIFQYATQHWTRIRMMMERFGQKTPNKPTIPDEKTRILRARLIMEEALETIQKGLGVEVAHVGPAHNVLFEDLAFDAAKEPNVNEIADGCADISVVTIGTLVACGIPDHPILAIVDNNNLEKVERGRIDEHGKFRKHPDHMPPNVTEMIEAIEGQLERKE